MSETTSNQSYFERFRRQMDLMQFETLPLFSRPLFSWNLKTDVVGRRLMYRPSTESTQDDARRVLERWRAGDGTLMLAESQSAGRGRDGRAWVSPPDVNLYFTLVVYTGASGPSQLAFVAPLAIAAAIEHVTAEPGPPIRPALKWPNDVLIDGLKVAGVLIETARGTEGEDVALVGAGINVNMRAADYQELSGVATSVRQAAGYEVARELLLAEFCNSFELLWQQAKTGHGDALFEAWKARLVTLGAEVTARGAGETISGRGVDVLRDGTLVIETPDGRRIGVKAGDVTLSSRA